MIEGKELEKFLNEVDDRIEDLAFLLKFAPFQVEDEKYTQLDDYISKNLLGPLMVISSLADDEPSIKRAEKTYEMLKVRLEKGDEDFESALQNDVDEARLYSKRYNGNIYEAWAAAAKQYNADPDKIII